MIAPVLLRGSTKVRHVGFTDVSQFICVVVSHLLGNGCGTKTPLKFVNKKEIEEKGLMKGGWERGC